MTRWEYGMVRFDLSGHEDSFDAEKAEILKIMNIWGGIGYELVSFTPEQSGIFLAIFKRPKE